MQETMQLPILGPGIAGRSKAITAQKRQNLFMEVKAEKDKTTLAAYGTPGLKTFIDLGNLPCRGIWWYQPKNFIYVVCGNELIEIHQDQTSYVRGALNSTNGSVSIADNGSQLIIVDGPDGYIFTKNTPELYYSKDNLIVTVQEQFHSRKTGQTVEIVGDANLASGFYTITVPQTIATNLVANEQYVITSVGDTDFTTVGATLNEVGIIFTATGPTTSGNGLCANANTWTINVTGAFSLAGTLSVVNNFRNIKESYSGVNFPGANTVVFIDSYFAINNPNTKQFWLSGSYDGFYWDPLQFASKEAYTDNLNAVAVDNGNLVLLGEISQEYWQDIGAFPFPFARISGSPTDTGLAARFSVARCAGQLFYLGKTRRGGISVFTVENYRAVPVSTPDLDYLLNQYTNVADAIAFSYRQNGHDFYQISFQQDNATWLYDATTQAWSVLQSGYLTRHYAQFGTQLSNEIIVTDFRNGNLYTLDAETYTDNGDEIARELITPHFFAGNSFNKLHIYRLRLDMQQGVGLVSGQGSDPQIMLQVSRDGGFTYGNEMWTSFGAAGEYLRRAEWRRLGVSRNYVFKFRITDPVKVIFIGAAAEATMADK
jgi:hypothetical protein